MGEVLNIVVAVAVVALVFRWATSGSYCFSHCSNTDGCRFAIAGGGQQSGQPNPGAVLGFRPRNVTEEMVNAHLSDLNNLSDHFFKVETVRAMFPDIPKDNIRYDLLKTGNTELTTNTILEKGFLEAVRSLAKLRRKPISSLFYSLHPHTTACIHEHQHPRHLPDKLTMHQPVEANPKQRNRP
jgi:hypothetical protein